MCAVRRRDTMDTAAQPLPTADCAPCRPRGVPRARPARPRATARGLTLVELLVVIAVIGILVSLLLPAVQAAREAARRTGCANNLRQIGIALHNYHDAHERFPPGGIEHRMMINPRTGRVYGRAGRQLAWSLFLLPYLEQEPLYEQIDTGLPFDAPANAEPAATVLSVYVCPSVPGGSRLRSGRGPSQYGGIYGERITGANQPPKGVMLYDYAVRIAEILDGTSTTLAVAEDGDFADGQWINGLNVFDQAFAINRAPAFENDIRSKHPGGALGVFCDSAVHFLSETMELRVLAALCTRRGQEVVAFPE